MHQTTVLDEIGIERDRQVQQEGYGAAHDDAHVGCELAFGAVAYVLGSTRAFSGVPLLPHAPELWMFEENMWKPTTARRNLIKASAMLVAEIERLDRKEAGGASLG